MCAEAVTVPEGSIPLSRWLRSLLRQRQAPCELPLGAWHRAHAPRAPVAMASRPGSGYADSAPQTHPAPVVHASSQPRSRGSLSLMCCSLGKRCPGRGHTPPALVKGQSRPWDQAPAPWKPTRLLATPACQPGSRDPASGPGRGNCGQNTVGGP